VDKNLVEALFQEIRKVHSAGFFWGDLKYSNILVEKISGRPYLLDFNLATEFKKLNKNFLRIIQDKDLEHFNFNFGTKFLTYNSIKEKIKIRKNLKMEKWGEPCYFGFGLRIGKIWDLNAGYGQWNFFLRHNLPSLTGKRILLLGANNGYTAIQFLRNGAQEIVGVENRAIFLKQGDFIKPIFEWVEKKDLNFKYIQTDTYELLNLNIGKFDLIFTSAEIFYQDREILGKLLKHFYEISDAVNVICDISRAQKEISLSDHLELLKNNGFPNIQMMKPPYCQCAMILCRK
jgi:serine/threonine protein kinase